MQKKDSFFKKMGKSEQLIAVFALVLSSSLLLSGCGKDNSKSKSLPEVQTNMMADASFIANVTSNRMEQLKIASKRAVTVDKMQKMIADAKKRLPANATDEQIRSELSKSEEWKALERDNALRNEELLQQLKEAHRLVGARMQQQRQDVQAVREGKAVPKPVATEKTGK